MGALHICRSFTKATMSPLGEISGRSPSPSGFGSPPSNGTDHTCTVTGVAAPMGLTGRLSFQFEPWSPPRT